MLSNIKAYQSETESQHSPSQNCPLCCAPGCLFTKGSLLILISCCHVCLYSHKIFWAQIYMYVYLYYIYIYIYIYILYIYISADNTDQNGT